MDPTKTITLIVTALFAFLAIVSEHYFPWQLLLKRDLPRIPAYVLGVLAFALPLTVAYVIFPVWRSSEIVIFFWCACGAAGCATLACHNLDEMLRQRNRASESEEREQALLSIQGADDDTDD